MGLKNYGSIVFDTETNRWKIVSLEPHVCISLKNNFQKLEKGRSVPFDFSHTPENCHNLLWFMQRYPMSISDSNKKKMQSYSRAYIDMQDQLERILLPDYKPQPLKLKEPWVARNYQLQVAEIHEIQKAFLLGDDIGLGKTMSATLTFNKKTLPALVVCPAHLRLHWKEKIEQYSHFKVHVIKVTKPYTLPKADVYVMGYSALAGWSDFYQTNFFKSVIFDEIGDLRHDDTKKYAGAQTLVYNVDYAMGLSATPVYNYGVEIFNIMNVLNPGCLFDKMSFLREWCDKIGDNYIVNDPPALNAYLSERKLLIRRTRKEVGRELPPINKVLHTVDYDSQVVKSAEHIAKQLALRVTTGAFTDRGQAARELDAFARKITGLSKARYVSDFVKMLLDGGEEKIVLGGWHRDVYDIWLEDLKQYNPVMYTGSESPAQKDKSKNEFIYGNSRLLILSIRSGLGLDGLQDVCRTTVIGELDWSPAIITQFIGRVDRDGIKEGVNAFICVSDSGSDPVMLEVNGLKAEQAYGIMDGLRPRPLQLNDESHLIKLAKSYLEKSGPTLFS